MWVSTLNLSDVKLFKGSDIVLSDYSLLDSTYIKVSHLDCAYITVTPDDIIIILSSLN
jgi:hypothetical protein